MWEKVTVGRGLSVVREVLFGGGEGCILGDCCHIDTHWGIISHNEAHGYNMVDR